MKAQRLERFIRVWLIGWSLFFVLGLIGGSALGLSEEIFWTALPFLVIAGPPWLAYFILLRLRKKEADQRSDPQHSGRADGTSSI